MAYFFNNAHSKMFSVKPGFNCSWKIKTKWFSWISKSSTHDYVINWKHFPRYWPVVLGIYQSPVNSPHKGQWRRALIFSIVCAWTLEQTIKTLVITDAITLFVTIMHSSKSKTIMFSDWNLAIFTFWCLTWECVCAVECYLTDNGHPIIC